MYSVAVVATTFGDKDACICVRNIKYSRICFELETAAFASRKAVKGPANPATTHWQKRLFFLTYEYSCHFVTIRVPVHVLRNNHTSKTSLGPTNIRESCCLNQKSQNSTPHIQSIGDMWCLALIEPIHTHNVFVDINICHKVYCIVNILHIINSTFFGHIFSVKKSCNPIKCIHCM